LAKNLFVVAVDVDDCSGRALDFAMTRAKLTGAEICAVHVVEWSPYSFLTAEELAERHKRRQEEAERAERVILGPVLDKLRAGGISAEGVVRYGHVANVIAEIATERDAVQIIIGRCGSTGLASRLFGSVAGALVQSAPVPVTVVP